MSSEDRFYQLQLKDRSALWGDVGSNIRIKGLVVGSNKGMVVLFLPNTQDPRNNIECHELTDAEWSDFIRRSDDPEILVGNPKVFQRKLRYEISGAIQQKVWAADGIRCMYCGVKMGEASMTIDHFDPLELGGANDESNYLTSCRACNKRKGNMSAPDWCESRNISEVGFRNYLKKRQLP